MNICYQYYVARIANLRTTLLLLLRRWIDLFSVLAGSSYVHCKLILLPLRNQPNVTSV